MPRPPYKRSKLNRPSSHKRVAPKSPNSPKIEFESKIPNKPIGARQVDSDDSDRLVTKRVSSTNNRRNGPPREVYASGAVAAGDVPNSHRSEKAETQKETRTNQVKQRQQPKSASRNQVTSDVATSLSSLQSRVASTHRSLSAMQSAAPATTTRISKALSTEVQSSPASQMSVLDALSMKPRKRQPSILQQIDNNSSSLNLEYEQEFLPDDESTPLHLSKVNVRTSTPLSSFSVNSMSRKRKLDEMNEKNVPLSQPEPELPPQQRPAQPLTHRQQPDHEDNQIMAPPESSSPLPNPTKSKDRSPVKERRKARAKAESGQPPTTEALQALMPARREQGKRQKTKAASKFEIPEDKSNEVDLTTSSEDQSVFLPGRRLGKAKAKQKELTEKRSKVQPQMRAKKKQNARVGTRSPSISIRSTPLVSSRRTNTKSPSQQPRTNLTTLTTKSVKTRSASTNTGRKGAEVDGEKENRRNDLLERYYARDNGGDRDFAKDTVAITEEIQDMKKKFADIDDWDMEFEDMSDDRLLSSPGKR